MLKSYRGTRAAFLCCALSVPQAGLANDPSALTSWTPGDTILITAERDRYAIDDANITRVPVPLSEVPQSIQVLTRTLIEEQQLNSLDEALRNVSGVVPSLPSETVLANPIVRGFEAEIFSDGLIGYADTAVIDPATLLNVQRIEVAKGPTSTLFGGGTGSPVGGLINLVGKSALFENRVELRARAGSFDTWQTGADLNLAADDRLGLRLVADYQVAGDAIDEVTSERLLVAPSLRTVLPTGTEIVARLKYSRTEQLEYVGLPAVVADDDRIDPFRFTGATDSPPTEVENLTVDLSVAQRLGDIATANFRARRYENDFFEFSSFPFFAAFPEDSGTTFTIIRGQLPSSVDEWTVDGSLLAEFETDGFEHVLLAGMQWDRVDYAAATGFDFVPVGVIDLADSDSDLAFGDIPPLTQFLDNRYETTAVYGQYNGSIADRIHVLASLRYNDLAITEFVGGNGNNETYSEWDPRVGVTFDIVEGLSVFAGYATGSRLSLFFNNPETAPRPERSESYEAGVKLGLADLGLSGTIAAFEIERTNVPTPDPETFFTSIQTGKQRSRGFEADLIFEPNPSWSFLATYAYTDAEVIEDTAIPAGDDLTRVPQHAGRIAGRYRILEGPLAGLGLGLGMTAASEAELTLPNQFQSDSHAVFDAQLSYDRGSVRLGLRVDNLLDSQYFLPYQYLNQAVVRPGNPRSAFVTLGAIF
ncbi:MAG: TonB-dependent siderophore receptor [Pacificimonas sp.]